MVNNTVNSEQNNNSNVTARKKRFKAAGYKETPKVLAVEVIQEDKEKIRNLRANRHVSIPALKIEPLNLQAGEFVSIKAYPGGNPKKENKKKENISKTSREDMTH